MKRHIPNMITSGNLICGAIATYFATQGAFTYAFAFICFGALFDFFDGMVARKLGVSGPLGIQMDSLADDITFGLAPSMIVASDIMLQTEQSNYAWGYWSLAALVMAAFSALRLAKFNIDTRQTTSFIGLATPANAIFWASLIAAFPELPSWGQWVPCVMMVMVLISCYLLISEIPMFSLKFKDFSWANNKVRYIFLIGCILLIGYCVLKGILSHNLHVILFAGCISIVWYVTINLLNQLTEKK